MIFRVCVSPESDSGTSGRLSKDGDLLWVTSEGSNVVANPFHGQALVLESEILGIAWSTWVPEDVNSEVEGDDDNVFRIGKVFAIVESGVTGTN